jgi:hypothetical protein
MKLRLGVGETIIGVGRSINHNNPFITFRQSVVRATIGDDVTNKCITPPDFTLEIVGLEGLVTLEKMIKQARENLQLEEDYFAFMVDEDHRGEEYDD